MTKRIEYIDALRGFTMILVVTYHVFFKCSNFNPENFFFNSLLCEFRMPLFFFVSGFVFYKASMTWNWATFKMFLKKKIAVQIITPTIFLFFWTLSINSSFFSCIAAPSKAGYWFTYVLFVYFLLYICIAKLSTLIHLPSKGQTILLLIIGFLLYFGSQKIFLDHKHLTGVLCLVQWIYFIFFVMGTLVRKHFEEFQVLLDSNWFIPLITSIFILLNFFCHTYAFKGYNDGALLFVCRALGPIIVFAFFRRYEASFTQETKLGSTLQYIGRRTLDIYLIHYFLVPSNLDLSFLSTTSMPIIELVITFCIGIIIVGVCLLISNIIRISPWVSQTFFGARIISDKK